MLQVRSLPTPWTSPRPASKTIVNPRDDPMGDHAAKLPGDTPQGGAAGREA